MRNKLYQKFSKSIGIAGLALIVLPAKAQDSVRVSQLNEVVVTATKFAKKQSETGKVLTVIDRQQLERSAGKSLSELLNEQTGLVINGAGSNPGKDKSVYLRGAKSEYTVILIDGIPVTDPSSSGGAFDLRLIPIDQIQRIEILKGGQSTLYGSDAIAGVINIITKKGGEKTIGTYGSLVGGSYRTFKANAGINGHASIFNYNLSYTHYTTDGISEAKDSTGKQNFDKDGFLQNAWQANLGVQATQHLNLQPFIRYVNFDGKYDTGAFTDGPETYQSNFLNAGISSQYTLHKGGITLNYGYEKTDRTYHSTYGVFDFKGRQHVLDAFMNYDLADHLQLLAGFDYRSWQMLDSTTKQKNPMTTMASPYASLFLKDLRGWNIELGTRFNSHSKYGNNFTYSFNPSYLIAQKVKLFVNLSSAFKAPSLSMLYGKYGANPNLKPEKSQSYEAGISTALWREHLQARLVGFIRNVQDIIIYGRNGYINQDQQKDHGFELELKDQCSPRFGWSASYAFVDGRVTTSKGGKDTSYFNLIRRPKHTIGIHLNYQITPSLYISTSLRTFSQRTDLDFNAYPARQVVLGSYALWDAYAAYGFLHNRFWLFVDLKNITNTQYSEVYGYNTMGFNVNTGLTFRL